MRSKKRGALLFNSIDSLAYLLIHSILFTGPSITCGTLSQLACDRGPGTDAGWNIVAKAVTHCNCRHKTTNALKTLPPGIDNTVICPTRKPKDCNKGKVPTYDGWMGGMKCQFLFEAGLNQLSGDMCNLAVPLSKSSTCQGSCRRNLRGEAEEFEDELDAAELEALESSPEYREAMEAFQVMNEEQLALPLN